MKTFAFIALFFVSVCILAQENARTISYSNITETGFMSMNLRGVAVELTTIHGFAIDNKHHLGFGFGIGSNSHKPDNDYYSYLSGYIPVFINYRLYFKPEQTRSPLLNASLGGVNMKNGGGFYSSFTGGYKIGDFSFSSGISFMAISQKPSSNHYYIYPNSPQLIPTNSKWVFPFGIAIKFGYVF